MKKQSAVRFFFKHAGSSWDPKTETKTQGRWRAARSLAAAERWAVDEGWSFDWRESNIDSSDFSDEKPAWQLWDCLAVRTDPETGRAKLVGSLSACDFGRDRDPWADTAALAYARLVRAEIALDAMLEVKE